MAAEIETMAFAGLTPPWHGMGVKVGDDLTPQQIMAAAGLDWTVSKRPLHFEKKLDNRFEYPIKDRFALVRDTDEQFLDVVGKTYRPTQNKDAFEFFDSFVKETKLKMHTAGSLCGGKYVWALAETNKSFTIGPQDDKVDSYVLLVSPHQFGKCLVVQQTTVRVVCQNTLNLALNEKGAVSYRLPHSKEFNAAAKLEAAKVMGLVTESFDAFKDQAESLAGHSIRRVEAHDFFSELLGLDPSAAANDEGQSMSKNHVRLMDAFEGNSPGSQLAGAKGTLWGAVNAVTYVMDHSSVRDKELAMRDNLFGYRGDLKRKALNLALRIAA